jgi:hypothetical protein
MVLEARSKGVDLRIPLAGRLWPPSAADGIFNFRARET